MLPPYTHVPGRTPHPINDPAGHSFGKSPAASPPPSLDNWAECESLREGAELFEAGYYWEAHEAWEQAWVAAGRRGAVADFLKGLIKLAAAGVKIYEGQPTGVKRHAIRAAALFTSVQQELGDSVLGYSIPKLIALARSIAEAPPSLHPDNTAGRPRPVLSLAPDRPTTGDS